MINTYYTHLLTKKSLAPNIHLFEFIIDQGRLEFEAGQYLVLFVPQENKDDARRLYSIATAPDQTDRFKLLVELIPHGVASAYFEKLTGQERVMFQGPAGMFALRQNLKEKFFLVTGTGIAPVRSMLNHHLPHSMQKFTLMWGLRYHQDIYFFDELKALAQKHPHFQFKICLSREPNLDKVMKEDKRYFSLGHVDTCFDILIRNWKLEIGNFDYYLCGGRDVVESLRRYLLTKNIPKESIVLEKF